MEEECYWQAVLNKDIKHDGEFVYGVRSTRIVTVQKAHVEEANRAYMFALTLGTFSNATAFA
jgi:methylphosphotriester-DNA--protein-cysteine methyltransferase